MQTFWGTSHTDKGER